MRATQVVVLCAAAGSLAGAASAQSVLVWATGNSDGNTAGIASWLQASGNFSSVDSTDATNVDLATLMMYDRVLFFTNSSDQSDPSNGDVLADYADTGRRLVLATFSWANQGGNTLGGRIINDEISPLLVDGSSLYTNVTLGSTDGSSYWDGVNSINGFFHDDVRLSTGAVLHGSWSDGEPLVASKGNVAAVNLFPDDFFGNVSGDHRQLFINALTVPVPGALGLAAAAGLVAARRRR
jgi:hypothetical protein